MDQPPAQPPGSPPSQDDAPGGMPPPQQPAAPPGSVPPPSGWASAPGAPPASPGAWPAAAPAAHSARPGVVTASAILLMTLGGILALFGLAAFLVGALWDTLQQQPEFTDQLRDLPESFGTFALVLGLVVLAWAMLEIVSGIFVLGRRRWARITAIILAILGVLAGLASLLQGGTGLTYVAGAVWILFIAGHAFVIWALASNGRWFSRA